MLRNVIHWFLALALLGPSVFATLPECFVTLPRLVSLDMNARNIVERYFDAENLKLIGNLHQRYRYVVEQLKKPKLPEDETRESLEAEKRQLEPLAVAYAKFARLANDREDLKIQTLYQSFPADTLPIEIELMQDKGLLTDFETSAKQLAKAYKDYSADLRARAKIFPYQGSTRVFRTYAGMIAKTRERLTDLIEKTLEDPYQGDILTSFPNNVRFLKLSTAEGGVARLLHNRQRQPTLF